MVPLGPFWSRYNLHGWSRRNVHLSRHHRRSRSRPDKSIRSLAGYWNRSSHLYPLQHGTSQMSQARTRLSWQITTGPACYPIVAEVPSGRLRYKTITLGRFVYNLTGIFSNSVTPRMIQPKAAGGWGWGPLGAGFFYAGTNLLSLIWCWFRLPETKVSDSIT